MARKKNSEMTTGAIVVSFSLQKELKPNLAAVSEGLKLRSVSELIALVALDPAASIAALAPLAGKLNEHRAEVEAAKTRQRENIAKLKDLSPEQLDAMVSQVKNEKAA